MLLLEENINLKPLKRKLKRKTLSRVCQQLVARGLGGLKSSFDDGIVIPSKGGVMQATDSAIASLRDIVKAVGAGGAAEDILVRELKASGMDELGWLQRLRDMLVQLNVLIEDHIDELVREHASTMREASDLATRLN